jgi:hypothetical protein
MKNGNMGKDPKKRPKGAIVIDLLSPFIGFLFSATKLRIEDKTGLRSLLATRYSIMLEAGLVAVFLSQIFINQLGAQRPPFRIFGLDLGWLGLLLFLPDLCIRLLRLLDKSPDQFGFYEWLVRALSGRRRR